MPRRVITRRGLLFSMGGAAAAAASYPTLLEPRSLEVTHTRVPFGARLRVLQLTDLHASPVVPYSLIEHAIALGIAQKPDIACLTGDFVTNGSDLDSARYAAILKKLSAAVPTYAVLGNHDGGAWSRRKGGFPDHTTLGRLLDQAGIEFLHKRSVTRTFGEKRVALAGVGDIWSEDMDLEKALREVGPGTPTILLSHNPDAKEFLRGPWHLMLCGHTHGGQVIVPGAGAIFAPIEDLRYLAGLNPWEGRQIYTSRGIGAIYGVRFRCRPEVTILDLV